VPRASQNSQESVSGNGGIDFQAPAIDAACHALACTYALLAQPVNHVQTSNTVVAKDNERLFVGQGFQTRKLGRNAAHGDQLGALDARDLKLARFANIDERQLLASQDPLADLLG
jgi:hypothetical protein